MKKNNKKIKAPKYAFGAKEISGLALIGGNIAQGFNTGNQTAQTVFNVADSVSEFLPGPAKWIGKAVSGVGKMITSIVGTKGSVDPVTGEITEGTGIKGRKNRKNLIQQSGIVKNNIAAALNSLQLAADYYQENGNNIISVVADGGIIPNTLAYLDDGELIRTPDGSINEIPEEGKPEDSNLMNVPVGTQVLSDKIKVPGTNKTFALKGKEIMKTNKYKGKDKYAENSKMLNDRNAQIAYDNLLALQESLKDNKLIKQKVNKYDKGTSSVEDGLKRFRQQLTSLTNTTGYLSGIAEDLSGAELITPLIDTEDTQLNLALLPTEIKTSSTKPAKTTKSNVSVLRTIGKNPAWNNDFGGEYESIVDTRYANSDGQYGDFVKRIDKWLEDDNNLNLAWKDLGKLPLVSRAMAKYDNDKRKALRANYNDGKYGEVHDWFENNSFLQRNVILPKVTDDMLPRYTGHFSRENIGTYGKPTVRNFNDKKRDDKKSTFDVSDFISSLAGASAGLIGPIANMTAKRGETNVPYTYTPKYGPTEWNIDPQLREINRSNAIARYNQSRLSPNTGAGLAFGIQSAIARNDAMARAYAEKNNMENQMAMANAGIYNDAARYNTQAMHTAAIENAQDRAAVDTARRTGLRDLGTALQTMSKDRRLSKRDEATLAAMEDFLKYGMETGSFNKMMSLLKG